LAPAQQKADKRSSADSTIHTTGKKTRFSGQKTVSSTAIFDDRPHLRTIETKIAMMFGKAFPSARQNVGVTNFSRSGRGNRACKRGGRSASARRRCCRTAGLDRKTPARVWISALAALHRHVKPNLVRATDGLI
jgi:hypothetical protein